MNATRNSVPRPRLRHSEWRLVGLFSVGIGVLALTFVVGFTLRAPLGTYVPGSPAAADVAAKFVGSAAHFWATLGLVAILSGAYVCCLVACARGFPWMFAAAVVGCAIVGAALIPMRPLSSPDSVHLAADVRTLWIHGEYPAAYAARPEVMDDPIARQVVTFRNAPSGYGPVAYIIGGSALPFVGDSLPANIGGQKVIGLAFLVLAAALTGLLARALGQSSGLPAAIVGLNPVFLWEFAGEGHNDVIMVAFALMAVIFLVRGTRGGRIAGFGFGVASVLTKYGLAIAGPIVAAYTWPRFRKAFAAATVVLGGLVAFGLLADFIPTGGTTGPAVAIEPLNPWHVLASVTISPLSEYRKAWVGLSFFWMLLLLAYVVYYAPLTSKQDLVKALALFFAGYTFTSFPALLPWYTVWFMPFTILAGWRWLTISSIVLVAGYFVPLFALGADEYGVRPAFATATSTAIVLLWLVAGLTALFFYRRDRLHPSTPDPKTASSRQQRRRSTRATTAGRARN